MAKKLDGNTLNETQIQFFNDSMLFLSTAAEDGTPQVGPKGSMRVLDANHLIYFEYTYDHAYANVKVNNKVAVAGWDAKNHLSFRINGTAEIHEDDDFAKKALEGSKLEKAAVVVVTIDEIFALA